MPAVTLYRFRIELSDLDRSVYESLDFRVAMHPSETTDYLLTRVLAYALNWQEGLEFSSGGLHDAEEPAIKLAGRHGATALCIEIGNPTAKRLHKNSKAAEKLKIYTYKDPQALLREVASHGSVHKIDELEAFVVEAKFLDRLGETLERDNSWSLVYQEGQLTLSVGEKSDVTELKRISFS